MKIMRLIQSLHNFKILANVVELAYHKIKHRTWQYHSKQIFVEINA